MRALRFERFGPPSVLSVRDVPKPKPAAGEVLVEVRAAAINPSDVKNLAGAFRASLPRTPGRDFAGVVREGAAGRVGREVWGSGAGFGVSRDGSHAEFVTMAQDGLSEKPATLTMAQAAAVGVAYLAAWSALIVAARLQTGETVLVTGALGAVGRAATQIAHWKAATVIGAGRSRASSPSDAFIDVTDRDLAAGVKALTGGKGADVVLDTVGGLLFEPALRSLRIGGRQVAISSADVRRVEFDLVDFYHRSLTLFGVDTLKFTGPQVASIMDCLRAGFEEGDLHAPEVETMTLEAALDAYRAVELAGGPMKRVLLPHHTE